MSYRLVVNSSVRERIAGWGLPDPMFRGRFPLPGAPARPACGPTSASGCALSGSFPRLFCHRPRRSAVGVYVHIQRSLWPGRRIALHRLWVLAAHNRLGTAIARVPSPPAGGFARATSDSRPAKTQGFPDDPVVSHRRPRRGRARHDPHRAGRRRHVAVQQPAAQACSRSKYDFDADARSGSSTSRSRRSASTPAAPARSSRPTAW